MSGKSKLGDSKRNSDADSAPAARWLCHIGRWTLVAFLIAVMTVEAFGQQARNSVGSIEALIRSQKIDEALQATQSALHAKPSDYRLWTIEGILLSKKGNNKEALVAFEKALRLSPTYLPALKGEIQLLFLSGDKRAIPSLQKVVKADPSDNTALEMLAILERREGDCRSASEHFRSAGEAIRTHTESLEAEGFCLVELNQFDQAIPVFEQLVTLLPERTYPKYDLAVVLVASKQNEEAVKVLEPLLTEDQRDPDILSLASQAYEATGDTPKAVALLRQAIVLSPTTAAYYVSFADICLSHDSFQVGIDMINVGLQHTPDAPALLLSRGLLYAQIAQYDKAEADFSRVEKLDAAQSLGSYALDLTALQQNNPNAALEKVRSQLKAHPNDALLNFLLAQLLMDKAPEVDSDPYKQALKSALLAVKLKPDHVGSRDLLASIYMIAGKYDLAIEQCQIALKYAPSDETATYHLVISLRHLGHKEELAPLVKRLAQLHKESLQQETDRKRFRLVVGTPPPAKDLNGNP